MQIHFHPSSLAAAPQAAVLFRLLKDSRPTGMYGQFSVTRTADDQPLVLHFRSIRGIEVRVTLNEELLWTATSKPELREKVAEVVGKVRAFSANSSYCSEEQDDAAEVFSSTFLGQWRRRASHRLAPTLEEAMADCLGTQRVA